MVSADNHLETRTTKPGQLCCSPIKLKGHFQQVELPAICDWRGDNCKLCCDGLWSLKSDSGTDRSLESIWQAATRRCITSSQPAVTPWTSLLAYRNHVHWMRLHSTCRAAPLTWMGRAQRALCLAKGLRPCSHLQLAGDKNKFLCCGFIAPTLNHCKSYTPHRIQKAVLLPNVTHWCQCTRLI